MYKNKGGGIIYETLAELLSAGITYAAEYEGNYYIKVRPAPDRYSSDGICYDNEIWKVDKKTGKASYMMFTQYILMFEDKATPVDPETLRSLS